MKPIQPQTLALASMFQSASLINQLAHGEAINQAAFDCSIDSLFTADAASTEDIYGHGEGLLQGLKTLIGYLGGNQKHPDQVIVYYVLSMLKLESKLRKHNDMGDVILNGLKDIEQHAQDFEMSRISMIHKIDGLYQKTLSQIKPRVMVQGDQSHLSASDNTSKIRSLLFAGVRAAVLWRQLGGSRWVLIFKRKQFVIQAQSILQHIQS